ncbi:hypothetical protein AB0E75_24135 [Streptomyces griseoviridis]|uniref:Uncharacterized protein n=2 Tax=Streptomyces griseoviridis TaxID=45398 RepID=A0ABT9LJX2_STRGD|nr:MULTISPECIES: hypothetical protein [Streptomyces]MDP9683032.1 hypothetical protein [Streptomyces griseoviridis]GGS36897.1 hypothetical protein GCM10010238_27840 [Streptomyces niveoruber]
MLERPRTAERYVRAAVAAAVATACLLLAGNTGPAHSAQHPPAPPGPSAQDDLTDRRP